jgi:hypothetical protein
MRKSIAGAQASLFGHFTPGRKTIFLIRNPDRTLPQDPLTLSDRRPRSKRVLSMSAQALSAPSDRPPVAIRRATPEDAAVCGQICFDAFYKISTDHGFPPDFPSAAVAVGLLSMMFSHPGFYGVVAESEGRLVGSNCLDERSAIAGIGPITVEPGVQNRGMGRKLMEAVGMSPPRPETGRLVKWP